MAWAEGENDRGQKAGMAWTECGNDGQKDEGANTARDRLYLRPSFAVRYLGESFIQCASLLLAERGADERV